MNVQLPHDLLWQLGSETINELEVEDGILASSREEVYGCIFGRDSLITSLKLLAVYERKGNPEFAALVRKILLNLCKLQGTKVNRESGEEPGKCIHEYRPSGHEHLTKHVASPWYVYEDNVMRNYDTVDATPLFLIALSEYQRLLPEDEAFRSLILPHALSAIQWIYEFGDSNHDGLIDYTFHSDRVHGGLRTQSWMDSTESVFHEDGTLPVYPISPVEVQAYAFWALNAWADYLKPTDKSLSERLQSHAGILKDKFNARFVLGTSEGLSLAFAVDGAMLPLSAARSSIGHILWAAPVIDGAHETILDKKYIPLLVERLMAPDLFVPQAGFRTLSSNSSVYDPMSYHNGSIWPHDTAITEEGLRKFGYSNEADAVRSALIAAYAHFNTPVELFAFNGDYVEYRSLGGQMACKKQAWSAASLLSLLA